MQYTLNIHSDVLKPCKSPLKFVIITPRNEFRKQSDISLSRRLVNINQDEIQLW